MKIKDNSTLSTLPLIDKSIKTNFPFYVIEGIDGSGKSSLSPLIAEAIGGACHEYPAAFKPALDVIDKGASPEARFMFYMAYNVQTSNDVSILAQNKPVICVRYIYSTMVYHIAKGVEEQMIFDIVKNTPLIRPKKVFFLDVSDKKVQMERLNTRGLVAEDYRVLEKMDLIRSTYLKLSSLMPNFVSIDTSYMTKEEVVSTIVKNII